MPIDNALTRRDTDDKSRLDVTLVGLPHLSSAATLPQKGRYALAVSLDPADRAIISALKRDARMPFSQIAAELGVSPGMVRQRVQRMTDSGLLQLVAVTNPLKIGYHTMALIGVKADGHHLQEIARQIAAFEEVIYLTICSAAYNLLVEVACLDNGHLLTFLTEKLYSVEGVRDTETFIYLDIVKEIYTWDPPAMPGPHGGAATPADAADHAPEEVSMA